MTRPLPLPPGVQPPEPPAFRIGDRQGRASRSGQLGPTGQLVFAVAWCLFVVFIGVVMLRSMAPSIAHPVPATAVVVGVNEDYSSKTGTCSLAYDLHLADGSTVAGVTPFGSNTMCSRRPGDVLDVAYDRADPSRVSGFDPGGSFAALAIMGGLGAAGVGLLVLSVRRLRRARRVRRMRGRQAAR